MICDCPICPIQHMDIPTTEITFVVKKRQPMRVFFPVNCSLPDKAKDSLIMLCLDAKNNQKIKQGETAVYDLEKVNWNVHYADMEKNGRGRNAKTVETFEICFHSHLTEEQKFELEGKSMMEPEREPSPEDDIDSDYEEDYEPSFCDGDRISD